ncbi:MAG: hypothetical protein CVU39_07545 [Chloroflexi bacterium HGW-Chloroflexi-10]|nr:MAG: hypothetical protein CVU39_07545 [Chloroflexi bacterium HGW-Chloroflexi-10]
MRRQLLIAFIFIILLSGMAPYETSVEDGTCLRAYGQNPQEIPTWLRSDTPEADLATSKRYELLASQLLKNGIVDGSACPGTGLNADGSANGCGIENAQAAVIVWQNQYDHLIWETSQRNGLSPVVLKAVMAVESQFWPGADWHTGEVGFGQMTEMGADLVLTWRFALYQDVCRQVFDAATCTRSYIFQDEQTQRLLRGQVLKNIDATCPTCVHGIDQQKAEAAVSLLAETIQASCAQSARLISGITGHAPAAVMDYEDFWRFVLANYHSGAGCMSAALHQSKNSLAWPAIAASLPSGCWSGAVYVRRIETQIIR